MTLLESILSFALFAMYIVCLFTVCAMTFAKGRSSKFSCLSRAGRTAVMGEAFAPIAQP